MQKFSSRQINFKMSNNKVSIILTVVTMTLSCYTLLPAALCASQRASI